ncbi:hypothetical protein Tco_0027064 [Tanacetum coccineum]
MPRECLKIIESKSKVRQTRAKAVVAKVSTNSSTQAVSSDVAELKDIVRALLLDKKNQASAPAPAPAPVKAVELSCVTCGGAHSHKDLKRLLLSKVKSKTFPSHIPTRCELKIEPITALRIASMALDGVRCVSHCLLEVLDASTCVVLPWFMNGEKGGKEKIRKMYSNTSF